MGGQAALGENTVRIRLFYGLAQALPSETTHTQINEQSFILLSRNQGATPADRLKLKVLRIFY